jgi:hypothetical protein
LSKRMTTRPGDTMTSKSISLAYASIDLVSSEPSPPTINPPAQGVSHTILGSSNRLLASLEANTICRENVFVNRTDLKDR